MTSQVDICNLALTRIGGEFITAIDEDSRAARLCNLHYEPTLRSLLRDHEWNFSVKRQVLAQDVTAPVSEYAYRYALPSDWLKVCRINAAYTDEYRVESGYLLTNEGTVVMEYVATVDDPNRFDSLFVDLFAQRLAAEISYTLTENTQLSESAWRVYNDKIRLARTMDARDGKPRDIEADVWLDARH